MVKHPQRSICDIRVRRLSRAARIGWLLLAAGAFPAGRVAATGHFISGTDDYQPAPETAYAESTPGPAPRLNAREIAERAERPSAHQAQMQWYSQYPFRTEAEYDQLRPAPRKGAAPAARRGGAGGLSRKVFGWLPYWEGTAYTNFDYSLLSTIAYFSYEVNTNTGGYVSIHSWATTPLISWAHSNGVKVVLTATCFGNASNQRLLESTSSKTNLIQQLVSLVQSRGADGVNLDLEGISSSSLRTNLTAFLQDLADRLHADVPGAQISIALPSVDWGNVYDVAAYDDFMDQCLIMGYDYYWSTASYAGPTAPLKASSIFGAWCVERSIDDYLADGLSASKLLLACPYYGYEWPTVSTALHAATTGSGTARLYPTAVDRAATYGYIWDTNSSTPYFVTDTSGSYTQGWLDDTNSLGLKYQMVKDKGLGGVGMWALGYDEGRPELWRLLARYFTGEPANWTAQGAATAEHLYGIAYGGGRFVAVGANGSLVVSPDGVWWSPRVSGTGALLLNACQGSGGFVVVGDSGTILTSAGDSSWTARSSGVTNMLRGVAYGDSLHVAVGNEGAAVSSPDGATWTPRASGTAERLQDVCFGNHLFVAVGSSGVILTTTNAVTWSNRASGVSAWLLGACYGSNLFVAVGNSGTIVTSTNGVTWTSRASGTTSNLYRVAHGQGYFVAVGLGGTLLTSPDGVNWTVQAPGTTNNLRGVAWGGSTCVAAGFGATLVTSGEGAPAVGITTADTVVPATTATWAVQGLASNVTGHLRWSGSAGGSGTLAVTSAWAVAGIALGDGVTQIEVVGTNNAGQSATGRVAITRQAESAAAAAAVMPPPHGALTGMVVFCSAGHGFYAHTNYSAWLTGRGLTNGMVEDMGNVDQLNLFAEYCLRAGATVVPFRPVGYQTNEVVLDNDDAGVSFTGTWVNSTATTNFYGSLGDVAYRYAYVHTGRQTAGARYTPTLPESGFYPVYCWTRRATDRVRQLYRITHSGGVQEMVVNHRRVGCGWVWLGTYYFDRGTNGSVEISNFAPGAYDTNNNVVIADAIRFGNGMGTVNRGFGVSGFERELECARNWVQSAVGPSMDPGLYDRPTLDDNDDNVGVPARMADFMNDESDGGYWDRIYLGFHSNADGGAGAARGPQGLYSTANPSWKQYQQTNFSYCLVQEIKNDMEWADNGVLFQDEWSESTADIYGASYGEISHSANSNMNSTIIEVGYHNNTEDAKLLKDPAARRVLAMACYQGLIKHLNRNNATNVPLAFLPDPPTQVRAWNSGAGELTVAWNAPTTNSAGGDAATGYLVLRSTNGYGFGNPLATTNTALTITGLTVGATWYFQVVATNRGGLSWPSATVGARLSPMGRAFHLVVNGFDRFNRSQCPTRYVANAINGYVALVRPRQVNSFDYVAQHGSAIAAAGRYFDSCDHWCVASNMVALTNYHAAYWILGEESTVDETFGGLEQTNVMAFLNQGGCLMASGAELGWDLDAYGSAADKAFFTNYLRAAYVRDDAGTYQVTAKAGGLAAGLGTLTFDNGSNKIYDVDYPDVLAACGGAATALVYSASSASATNAAIQSSNVWRTVVMGFPFETLVDPAARTGLMASVVRFFGDDPAELPVIVVTNTDQSVAYGVSSFTLGGTNNAAVTGQMTWTNALTGDSGSLAAVSVWSVAGVPLGVGTNVVTVRGTNYLGRGTNDAVTIARAAEGGGTSTNLLDEPFDAAPSAPAGWTFTGVSSYSTAANAGRNPPSVKFDSDGDQVTSTSFSGGTNLTFFIRANPASGSYSEGSFVIEAYDGGWATLGTLSNPTNVGSTQVFAIATSVTRLRFTWNKTAGNIAFDDVIVSGPASGDDGDGDGMADWWEILHFTNGTAATAAGDYDGDGANNHAEWIAGTEPTNAVSVFRIASLSNTAAGVYYLRWPSVADRTYAVRFGTNPLSGFGDFMTGIAASPPFNVVTDTTHSAVTPVFYHLKVSH